MSTVQVDTINESTTGSGVTVDGVLIKDSAINASSVSGINRKNVIINGNFDIWQRGTSFTATGYTADRWYAIVSGTGTTTISQQSFTLGQTDVPNEPKYYLRIAKSSGATSGDYLSSKNENVRTFAGQATVVSFYAKASAATTLTPTIRQNFGTGGSPSSVNDSVKSDISVTTSWQKFTITHTFDSISGKTLGTANDDHIELFFNIQNGAGDSVDFAQFQWEKGSVATDFEVRPIGEELSLCQRYYSRTTSEVAYYGYAIMLCQNAAQYRGIFPFVNTMREAPTISYSGSFQFAKSGVSRSPSSAFISTNGFQIDVGGSGFTVGDVDILRSSNDTSAYLEADAEL